MIKLHTELRCLHPNISGSLDTKQLWKAPAREKGHFPMEKGEISHGKGAFSHGKWAFLMEKGHFSMEKGNFPRKMGISHEKRGIFPRKRGYFPTECKSRAHKIPAWREELSTSSRRTSASVSPLDQGKGHNPPFTCLATRVPPPVDPKILGKGGRRSVRTARAPVVVYGMKKSRLSHGARAQHSQESSRLPKN